MFRLWRPTARVLMTPMNPPPTPPTPPAELGQFLVRFPTLPVATTMASPAYFRQSMATTALNAAATAAATASAQPASQNIWGPFWWQLFHTLAEHLIDDAAFARCFGEFRTTVIYGLTECLPCHVCRGHAKEYLALVNWSLIRSRADLIQFFWAFHEFVNFRVSHPAFPRAALAKYAELPLSVAVNAFFAVAMNQATFTKQKNLDQPLVREVRLAALRTFLNTYATCFVDVRAQL